MAMMRAEIKSTQILLLVTPYFNLATTSAFLDPFRVANYLIGDARFRWNLVSTDGSDTPSSNGMRLATEAIETVLNDNPDIVVVSSSWAPKDHHTSAVTNALNRWSRSDAKIGALDTGTFILARAGFLKNKRATVHYEHIDALIELHPDISVTEDLFVVDGKCFTCCGGLASADLALYLLRDLCGEGLANAVARYVFHHQVRGPETSQNPANLEPFGYTTPRSVRQAIDLMEVNLEQPLSIPAICKQLKISQRHLGRLFRQYVGKTPVLYYRDIRLDRARGLVTQTEMKLSEVAVASGFSSQMHFSRAYHERFGLPPKQDRKDGRVPFEFRAWPMHSPNQN